MGSKGIEYAAFVLTVIAVIVVVQWQINRLSKRKLTLSIFQVARRWTIVFYIVTALFLAFGVWYVSWFEANEYKEYKRFSEHFTKVFSTELFELHHESLNDETKETNPTYIHILKAMLRWQHDHPEIHNWYTLKKNKDGENYFVVAPEMDYNHNGIIDGKKEQRVPIGTVYRKRIPELEEAFQGKFSMQKEPTSNNWGENISTFSPIFDKSGKVNAVIGIDYDAKGYLKKLQQEREKGIAILFLMFLVYYAVYVLVIYIQIEKRLFQKHKKELEISQARFKRLSEVTMEGIVIHSQGKVVEVNESACRLFGYTESEFVHLPIEDLIVPESLKKLKNNGCREGTYEIDLRRKDGTRFPAEILQRDYEYDSKRVSVTAIRDITERKQNEEKMHYITFHDDLTGLPNKESLYQIITEHMKEGSQQAVMFIEMNGIKMINDLYGYSVGDQVLLGAASQIQKIMNDHMVLGRWGGNEFILIFPHIHRKEEVKEFAAQMIETLEEPIVVKDQEFFITARIGISLYPHDGTDAKTLIKKADIARYELGKKATSQYLFFKEQMNQTIQEKMTIEQELRRALEDGEFELYYQPQIRLDTGTVTGMEALIRWNHPEKGLIAPDTFIPVAEQTGFIIPINEWVIRTACQQTKLLLDEYPFLSVSVNLSPYEFESRRFVHKLVKILEETGLPPYCLDLEITERMAMDTEKAIAILHRLKSVGVMISMDDFGTGYSSLSYLKHLPIDRLKIDRSFVRNIQEEEAILPAIISLGHNIGMKVLAEGVETGQEVAYLKEKRCDEAQGYYYAKPLPFHEFVEFLRQYSQTKPRV